MLPIMVLKGITTRILLVPVLACLLGILIPATMAYHLLNHSADRETREKASMLYHTLAINSWQALDSAEKAGTCPEAKAAEAAATSMQRYQSENGSQPFQYRRAAVNPTNPRYKADENEARMITAFDADPNLKLIEEYQTRQNAVYRVVAEPIIVTKDACLRCHSTPSLASAEQLNKYGSTAGFGRHKGQAVGVSVLYLPAGDPMARASLNYWTVAKVVALLVAMCLVLLAWSSYGMVAHPINRLIRVSQAIRRGDWGARFPTRFPDEIGTLALSFQDTTHWLREQVAREEKLRALFQQFVPASVAARALGKEADEVLVGMRHSITVMVINIRNFKLLMEHLPPDQTVTTLNEFFSQINQCIVGNKGVVSKYLGDTVVAFFGMPLGNEDHSLYAVRAALAIPRALQNLYVDLDEQYGWELGVGIGISTGEAIVGQFGSSEHMEYAVLGDVVIEAHQLEEITKSVPEEDTVLVSESAYRTMMSDVHVYDLGEKKTSSGAVCHAYVVQGFRSEARLTIAA